jgi:hypothetical protein
MPDNSPALSVPARTLGEFACGLAFEHIPTAVLERAKLLILDALGCGITASAYGFADAGFITPFRDRRYHLHLRRVAH